MLELVASGLDYGSFAIGTVVFRQLARLLTAADLR
jgi:hypothetical protein